MSDILVPARSMVSTEVNWSRDTSQDMQDERYQTESKVVNPVHELDVLGLGAEHQIERHHLKIQAQSVKCKNEGKWQLGTGKKTKLEMKVSVSCSTCVLGLVSRTKGSRW
jgi:hypothetical protein